MPPKLLGWSLPPHWFEWHEPWVKNHHVNVDFVCVCTHVHMCVCIWPERFTGSLTEINKSCWERGYFPGGPVVKNPPSNPEDKRRGFDPRVGNIPWSRRWQPTPVYLPGKFHGQRSLAGYRPWGRKESDRTELLITAQYSIWSSVGLRRWC